MIQKLLMIIIILAIILGGGYYAYQQMVLPPPQQEAQGPLYATQPVQRGDISVGVEAGGPLNPSRGGGLEIPFVMGSNSGPPSFTVEEVSIKEGDPVKQGQVVALLQAPDIRSQIENLRSQIAADKKDLADKLNVSVEELGQIDPSRGITLRAPIAGRVLGLEVNEGKEVTQGHIVARIVNDSRFRMLAKMTPGEFSQIQEGTKAVLRFSQFDGLVNAEITKINPNPVPEEASTLKDAQVPGGSNQSNQYQLVYWVTLEADNPGLVQPGMLAQAGIIKGEIPDNKAEIAMNASWLRYYAEVQGYVDEEKVLSNADAIVTQIHVQEMENVSPGDALLTMAGEDTRTMLSDKMTEIRESENDLAQLQSQLGMLEVKSPMDGVVAYLNLQQGQTVRAGEYLGNIYNTSDMRMWVEIDDVDVPLVKQNAPVKVTVPALPGKTLKGTVQQISSMGQDRNGVQRFGVDIQVEGIPELRPGMQAQAYIDAGSATGVLLLPLEAIFEEDGKSKVEILQPDGTTKVVAVELGLMNDRSAEVKSGLEEGQLVITGSSADLLPSQHIGSQDTLLPGSGDNQNPDDGNNSGNGPGNGSAATTTMPAK